MKKWLNLLLMIIVMSILVYVEGCSDDTTTTPPTDPGSGSGATLSRTSDQSGTLEYDGFRMEIHIGDVPRDSAGNPGTVVFSLNSSSTIESGIPAVPSNYTVIGKYLKAGPEAFIFASTVQLYFPASSESTPQDLAVLSFVEESQEWKMIPFSALDTANRKVGIDLLKLGYFVLVKHNVTSDQTDFRAGGCVLDIPMEVFTNYILTVESVTPEKSEILNLYVGGLVGRTYMGPIFLGCQQNRTKAIVPQGSISFWVSKISCVDNNPQIFTYSIPASVTVSDPLNFVGWSTYDAVVYVPFGLPSGGSWIAGRPTGSGGWPPPTIPFGSGTVQATLTWVNTSSSLTDLDLHLWGPNGLHVYFGAPTSPNFRLDRDWTQIAGNAIENIFSTTSLVPAGSYRVDVNFWSGASKQFNCRVIVNGNVTNYSGTISSGGVITARTFTIQ